ncbi:2OG-Fe(II) oxygenase [Edaphobacter albus]|uniref:2OG-Fe(II) oxygenase n=1 Tax=Edaphobacter sp. 4G125 TaxID=2763071 RepID=UPI001643FF51|nr:2OG-Fe(II) oxygenase [Edaphobacter sp. 4G125]QNI36331.1 2OG-Fe(II) oxygenase [Edaphobacter sp. 4G125]
MDLTEKLASLDWPAITAHLNEHGFATIGPLLSPSQCTELTTGYDHASQFRSRVVMAKHGFGRGEYQYYAYPLPELIQTLRTNLYPSLAQIANQWNLSLNQPAHFPSQHSEFLKLCHQAGQNRPTPLLLKYQQDDYNCLHQDLYGELVFPLQVAFLLSEPGRNFTGGEFVLTEQRPRMQSRASVVPLRQGEAVIFAVNHRPQRGARGTYRVTLRHGVSTIRSGHRFTLGVIFHDAQ